MLIEWITNNVKDICMSAMALPLLLTAALALFLVIDDCFSRYAWFNKIVYNNEKRDLLAVEELFAKGALFLGIANIIVPCIVLYVYLYYIDMSFIEFVRISWNPLTGVTK